METEAIAMARMIAIRGILKFSNTLPQHIRGSAHEEPERLMAALLGGIGR
jgi:hypothetical protein